MNKPNIVVVGSLNMDLVVSMQRMPSIGETVLGEQIHYISGGKGANQAVGCSRLGANVTMIGAVGDDLFGKQIIERMRHCGVDISGISTIKETATGTATILHTHGDNCIIIVAGANDLCTPDLVDAHEEAIRSADALLVQLEVPLSTVRRALEIARSAGVATILNPAPARQLPDDLINLADIFTPNETEFEYYCGSTFSTEQELIKLMEAWRSRFNHTLAVTRGSHGVTCGSEAGYVTTPAQLVQVVDTTGAGDSFNAAMCYCIACGWDLDRSISFAVKAASLSVTKFGAQDGMPTMEEVTENVYPISAIIQG